VSRRRDVFRIVCIAWALGTAGRLGGQEDFTIRTTSRLVLLDVSVQDSQGGFVSGLSKDAFRVYEDGKPQVISQFADADIPVTVGIVVDESGSMRPKRPEVITAALAFIHASNPQDEMFVVNFNERARRGLPDKELFSDNGDELRAALWKGVPDGRTALYDAIEISLHQLDLGRRDKKTLVVISDGGDNVSKHSLQEVMQDALRSLATIYTVGIFDADDPERNPAVLEKLAHISGGGVYFPKKLEQIVPVCKQIAKDIRTRYTIGYIPPTQGKAERSIKVVAAAPRHGKLVVRTRSRYAFAPDAGAAGTK
jgi:Ca-activated chloride channel family protein